MTTRKEQAALSKQRLLQAATELIIQRGYNNISIVDITRACGMSVGNFYHYFKSKEELITVLEREGYDESLNQLQNMKDAPILEQMQFYLENYMDLTVHTYGHNFNRHWFIYYLNNPTVLDDPANKVNLIKNEICTAIGNAMENGELLPHTPAEQLAEQIAFSIMGANCYYSMTNGAFDPIAWQAHFCSDILPALFAKWYK